MAVFCAAQDLLRSAEAREKSILEDLVGEKAGCDHAVFVMRDDMTHMMQRWVDYAVKIGIPLPAAPDANAQYTPEQVSGAPFDGGQVGNWKRKCDILLGNEESASRAGRRVDDQKRAVADGSWKSNYPDLSKYLERSDRFEQRRIEVSSLRAAESQFARRCALAQSEHKYREQFSLMAHTLLKVWRCAGRWVTQRKARWQMGLPALRLASLDEHAWQLPAVVSNYADEMLADLAQQRGHARMNGGEIGCAGSCACVVVCDGSARARVCGRAGCSVDGSTI